MRGKGAGTPGKCWRLAGRCSREAHGNARLPPPPPAGVRARPLSFEQRLMQPFTLLHTCHPEGQGTGARVRSQWVLSTECQLLRRPAGEGPCATGRGRDAGGGWRLRRPHALGIWPAHQQCLHYFPTSVAIKWPLGRAVQAGDRARWAREAAGLGRAGAEGAESPGELGAPRSAPSLCPASPVGPLLFSGALLRSKPAAQAHGARPGSGRRVRQAAPGAGHLASPHARPPARPAVSRTSCPSLSPRTPFPPRRPSPASAALAGSPLRAPLLRLEAGGTGAYLESRGRCRRRQLQRPRAGLRHARVLLPAASLPLGQAGRAGWSGVGRAPSSSSETPARV